MKYPKVLIEDYEERIEFLRGTLTVTYSILDHTEMTNRVEIRVLKGVLEDLKNIKQCPIQKLKLKIFQKLQNLKEIIKR